MYSLPYTYGKMRARTLAKGGLITHSQDASENGWNCKISAVVNNLVVLAIK